MQEPIPQKHLERARRVTARHVAVAAVQCMADTDTTFGMIAKRIGRSEDVVRGWFDDMVDGKPISLEHISDFFLAMAAELEFHIRPVAWLNEPGPDPDAVVNQ
jgi:hypothetical protein